VTAQRTRTLLKVLGYAAFFGVCFVVSLVITFPYDRLTGYAEAQIEQATGLQTTIESIRPAILGGVHLEGVTLGPSLTPPIGAETVSDSPWVRIDEATVDVSLLSLLFGQLDTEFDLELAGGQAEGWIERDESHLAVELSADGLQAKLLPILREKVGLPVTGVIKADVELDLNATKIEESTGSVTLALVGGTIGDGEAKLSLGSLMGYGRGRAATSSDEGIAIPPIKLGPIGLETKLVKGQMEIPRVEATSEHAEVTFEGRVQLADPLANSRVDTYLTVKLTDAYAQQDETTGSLLSLADTVGRAAKRTDGAFGFRISGSFLRGLTFRPSKSFSLPGAGRAGRDGEDVASRRNANRRRPPGARRSIDVENDLGDEDSGETGQPTPAHVGPRPSIVNPGAANVTPMGPGPRGDPSTGPSFPNPNVYPSGMPRPAPPPPSVIAPTYEPPEVQQEEVPQQEETPQEENPQEDAPTEEGQEEDQ
jgi:type II secretion system protein N